MEREDENVPRKRVECNVANVVVPVEQEAPQDVDRQNAEAAVALHVHDGLNALVQNGIARIFRALRVGRDLGKDIVHRLRSLVVSPAKSSHKIQQFDLHKWIHHASHVVFGRKSHRDEPSKELDESGDCLCVLVFHVWLNIEHLEKELHSSEEHAVSSVLEQRDKALAHVLYQIGLFSNQPNRCEGSLFPQVRVVATQKLLHIRRQISGHVLCRHISNSN